MIWAAGHDQGLIVFKFINMNPISVCKDFFIRSQQLIQLKEKEQIVCDLKKNTVSKQAFGGGKVVVEPLSLHVLGEPYPFCVAYNDSVK
jgi:hypothetical protein